MEKAGTPAWRMLPSWYLVSMDYQTIHLDLERWMAQRMGAAVREVAPSHVSMLSRPNAVRALTADTAQAAH